MLLAIPAPIMPTHNFIIYQSNKYQNISQRKAKEIFFFLSYKNYTDKYIFMFYVHRYVLCTYIYDIYDDYIYPWPISLFGTQRRLCLIRRYEKSGRKVSWYIMKIKISISELIITQNIKEKQKRKYFLQENNFQDKPIELRKFFFHLSLFTSF